MPVIAAALPVAAWTTFDYWSPEGPAATRGAVVRVPLGRRSVLGVVVDTPAQSAVPPAKLQTVAAHLDGVPPLPADLLEMAEFASRYYQQPVGMVLAQMVPPVARPAARATVPTAWRLTSAGMEAWPARTARARAETRALMADWSARADRLLGADEYGALAAPLRRTVQQWHDRGLVEPVDANIPAAPLQPALNDEQQGAANAIAAATGFDAFLLDGVTGSGKTEVYIAAADRIIARGRQVLILVPEINLTPQAEQRIMRALVGRRVVTMHSRLSAGERMRAYCEAASGEADLVLGTRLAIFAPLPRLGLIVVDEEHDTSFKQQDNVRYHARDLAVWRARQRGLPVVLGSATPSLESLVQVRNGRYRRLVLSTRAVAPARMPVVSFEPARAEAAQDGLGPALLAAIAQRLSRGEQSLVFINRRGFAPSLLCGNCGWSAQCPHCSARLVVHRHEGALRCHHCGHATRLTRACPECGNVDLLPLGHGTQRLEAALRTAFPAARIARVDRDTTQRKGAFAAVREEIHAGNLDILVGTQMLAKGHDFPRLTLVGVLGADNALYSADFRATERLGALLFQVAGRAGRAELPGEVIIATDFPGHALYRAVAGHDYQRLAEVLLADRRAAGMPPYSHLAMISAEAPTRAAVDAFLQEVSSLGRGHALALGVPVEVFAPVPATLARRAGMERGQVLAQSEERGALQRFLPGWREFVTDVRARGVRWAIDVDPIGVS